MQGMVAKGVEPLRRKIKREWSEKRFWLKCSQGTRELLLLHFKSIKTLMSSDNFFRNLIEAARSYPE